MSKNYKLSSTSEDLRTEFNRWAQSDRGQQLEHHHSYITRETIRLMGLKPGDRVLDLGCGTGWATCWLASLLKDSGGHATGLDISEGMIEAAKSRGRGVNNVSFHVGSAEKVPFEDGSFDKVLCVESFYYYPDLTAVLKELKRVVAPTGRIFILVDLYADRPFYKDWSKSLGVPVHVLSESQYLDLLNVAGFGEVEAVHIPDRPTSAGRRIRNLLRAPLGKWIPMILEHFKRGKDVRQYRQAGALLLTATRVQAVNESSESKRQACAK